MSNIYLIGYRGSGKTTLSRLLAARLNRDVFHLDEMISDDIEGYVKERGWGAFRKQEKKVLQRVSGEDAIIDCGGGIVLDEENVRLMKSTGKVIWLAADMQTIRSRLLADRKKRPPIKGKDPIEEIDAVLKERVPLYERAADLKITKDSSEEIVREVVNALHLP